MRTTDNHQAQAVQAAPGASQPARRPLVAAKAAQGDVGDAVGYCVRGLLVVAFALFAGCATSGPQGTARDSSVASPVDVADEQCTDPARDAQSCRAVLTQPVRLGAVQSGASRSVAGLPSLVRRPVDPVAELQRVDDEPDEGAGAQTQIGRYTSQDAVPPDSAAEPLAVYARINFPRSTVRSVGDAIRHVLLRTGYRLVDEAKLGEYARDFLALPLPEHQRSVGPYQVRTILHTLLGPAWQLQRDPITRDVWFTVSESHMALVVARRQAALAAGSAPGDRAAADEAPGATNAGAAVSADAATTRAIAIPAVPQRTSLAPPARPLLHTASAAIGPRLPAPRLGLKPTPVPGAAPLLPPPPAAHEGHAPAAVLSDSPQR